MTYRANPVLQKLDEAAKYTGLPIIQRWADRALPMPFRIAPAVLIGLAIVAVLSRAWWSLSLLMLVWTISLCLHGFGPLRTPPGGRRDERERVLLRDGHFIGMAVTLSAVIFGCMIFTFGSAAALFGRSSVWVPSGPGDWAKLTLFLMMFEANAALLAVSWMVPRRLPRDEDEG